jgi:hypothetical protein
LEMLLATSRRRAAASHDCPVSRINDKGWPIPGSS